MHTCTPKFGKAKVFRPNHKWISVEIWTFFSGK